MVAYKWLETNTASAFYIHCYITYSKFSFCRKYHKYQKYQILWYFRKYFPTLVSSSISRNRGCKKVGVDIDCFQYFVLYYVHDSIVTITIIIIITTSSLGLGIHGLLHSDLRKEAIYMILNVAFCLVFISWLIKLSTTLKWRVLYDSPS